MFAKQNVGWGLAALLIALLGIVAWKLGPALMPPTPIEVGIEIGQRAPIDLDLQDAEGGQTSLAKEAGINGTVLLMVRSVDWCPFCMAQIIEANGMADEVSDRGYSLVGLSYDPPEILSQFMSDEGLDYPLVSDRQSAFIDAVGLRDPQYADDPEADGVPYASVLVIAPDGTVRAKFVSEDYHQRPSNDFVLDMLDSVSR